MTKEKRLGRGLAALLGDEVNPTPQLSVHNPDSEAQPNEPKAESPVDASTALTGIHLLNVDEIADNPYQPRREFSEPELASLTESLKEHDMLQPVLVRKVDGQIQLISGERRLRAARQAGWTQVPAQFRDADDRLVAELAIVENLQRKDLNPLEKALSFQRYIEQHGCKQDDLAKRIKIDRSTIANLLRLLELPEEVKNDLSQGHITAGHARALLPLGDERLQVEFSQRIQNDNLSVRATESLVQERIDQEDNEPLAGSGKKQPRRPRVKNDHITSLEQELRRALGARVDIKQASKDRGKITIHFNGHEEFERIREYLSDTHTERKQAS